MQVETHPHIKIKELIKHFQELKKDMNEQAEQVDYEDHFAEGYTNAMDDVIFKLTNLIK